MFLISSVFSKQWSLQVLFSFQNRKKLHAIISNEYGVVFSQIYMKLQCKQLHHCCGAIAVNLETIQGVFVGLLHVYVRELLEGIYGALYYSNQWTQRAQPSRLTEPIKVIYWNSSVLLLTSYCKSMFYHLWYFLAFL